MGGNVISKVVLFPQALTMSTQTSQRRGEAATPRWCEVNTYDTLMDILTDQLEDI